MTRNTHEVNSSNAQRVQIANEAKADAFIRMHANGSKDPQVQGVMTICQTTNNLYNASMYGQSKALSTSVLGAVVETTGARKQYVWKTDTMTGINWAMVPSTIVEMGYMSHAGEERLLATEEYQDKMVQGIMQGIDQYFLE